MAEPAPSHLSPSDAVVAMRTWPRRYRAAFAPRDEQQIDEIAVRLGPDGVSALELAVQSVRTWVLLEKALHDIRLLDAPTVHPAVADPAARAWDSFTAETLDSVLEQIDDVSTSLADAIESMPSIDWTRTANVAGGDEIDALTVAQEAVRVGADNLRAIERTLSAVA